MAKNFCLLPERADQLREDLQSGKLKMADLLSPKMTSEKRTEIFRKYAGSSAEDVNLAFEEKRVLKNTTLGMRNFLNKATQMGKYSKEGKALLEKARADFRAIQQERILSPQEGETFYNDLADKMLDTHVSVEETKKVLELTKMLQEAKAKMNKDFTFPTQQDADMAGATQRALENFKREIRGAKEYGFNNPLKARSVGQGISAIGSNTKALVKFIADNTRALRATLDNSYYGNQGLRVLLNPRYSKVWASNLMQSVKDAYSIMRHGVSKGDDILDATYADVYGRKNYLNGRYDNKGGRKLDIGGSEEDFPTSLPTKIGEIPVLKRIPIVKNLLDYAGRAFKAAEILQETGGIRLRVDVADKFYDMAEKSGVDMTDPFEIGSKNTLINSMTGRGFTGQQSELGDLANSAFFSVKLIKSSFDFLTQHAFDPKVSAKDKANALKQFLYIMSTTAVLLGINKGFKVDDKGYNPFDPRSSDFGKLKVGNHKLNLMPGYGSMITLIAKLATQSYRDTTTGEIKPLNEKDKEGKPKYGAQTGMDAFWNFTENKFSPIASLLRDQARQYDFDQKTPTLESIAESSTTPITIENISDVIKSDSDVLLKVLVGLAGIVFQTDTIEPKPPKEEKKKKTPKRSF